MTKSPDGFICTNEDSDILAAMHAPGLHGAGEHEYMQGDANVYVMVKPPDRDIRHFKLQLHNDHCLPHEISRCSLMEHVLAKLHASVPLEAEPRSIYKSKQLGTVLGKNCLSKSYITRHNQT